jgi:CRP-like cAMP-binding protein
VDLARQNLDALGQLLVLIGLIRNIERTATVTAVTDAVLLSIESGPFITAVTGHPDSLQRADAIIDELLT